MKPEMEYLRQSGMDLAHNLLDIAGKGFLAPRIEELMCQAAGYIIANEGIIEKIQEELYLIEERLCIQAESEEAEAAAKAEEEDKSGWYSDESPTPAP